MRCNQASVLDVAGGGAAEIVMTLAHSSCKRTRMFYAEPGLDATQDKPVISQEGR